MQPVTRRDQHDAEAATPGFRQFLTHEWVFGLFLAVMSIRLLACPGVINSPAIAFASYLALSIAVIYWAGRDPAPWRWRVRLLLYPALMGLSFYSLPSAMALLQVPGADGLLASMDDSLGAGRFYGPLPGWQDGLVTDVMMLAYLFFFYYLIAGPAHYCIHDLPRFRQCFSGMFTIYGLGFIGYTLLPAAGPHRYLQFGDPLSGGWLTQLTKPIVDSGSNGLDAFPSIHVAVSLYLLVFDAWHCRRRFWWMLVPCIGLWMSTVYLRYHYVVDLGAGVLVAGIGLAVAARWPSFNWPRLIVLEPLRRNAARRRTEWLAGLFPGRPRQAPPEER